MVQELINRYEEFKKKGLQINEQDMFERLQLQDELDDKVIELKSKYLEEKLILDRDYGLRMIELKSQTDGLGKKLFTDNTAKGKCDEEFFDQELRLVTMKATYENLQNKANQCIEYINVIKLSLKKDFSI